MDSKENKEDYLDSLLRSVMEGGQPGQIEDPEEILEEIPEEGTGEESRENSMADADELTESSSPETERPGAQSEPDDGEKIESIEALNESSVNESSVDAGEEAAMAQEAVASDFGELPDGSGQTEDGNGQAGRGGPSDSPAGETAVYDAVLTQDKVEDNLLEEAVSSEAAEEMSVKELPLDEWEEEPSGADRIPDEADREISGTDQSYEKLEEEINEPELPYGELEEEVDEPELPYEELEEEIDEPELPYEELEEEIDEPELPYEELDEEINEPERLYEELDEEIDEPVKPYEKSEMEKGGAEYDAKLPSSGPDESAYNTESFPDGEAPGDEEPAAGQMSEQAGAGEAEELSLENELSSFLEEMDSNRVDQGQKEAGEENGIAMSENEEEITKKDADDMDELMRLLDEADQGDGKNTEISETDDESQGELTLDDLLSEENEEEYSGPGPDLEGPAMDMEDITLSEGEEASPGEFGILDVEAEEEQIGDGAEELEAPEELEIPEGLEVQEGLEMPEELEMPEGIAEPEEAMQEPAAVSSDADSAKLMSEDDIESLLASMEIEDADGTDSMNDDEMSSFLEQFPELGEGDLDLADAGGEGQEPSEGQAMKDTDLLDMLGGDEDMDELSALLKKDDNHELLDGIAESGGDSHASQVAGTENPSDDEEPKKKHRLFGRKKRERKKKGKDKDADTGDSGEAIEGEPTETAAEGAPADRDAPEGEPAEGIAVKPPKEPGFLSKLSQLFFEEIGPEDEEETEKEEKPKKAKGKKKKKDENQEILDEMDSEDAAKKKKGKKDKKEKKEKKEKKKAEKGDQTGEAAAASKAEEPAAKKIPMKKIVAAALFAATLLGSLLLLELLLPGQVALNNARKSYAKGDYEKAYVALLGMELKKDSDIEVFESAKALMKLKRRYDAYENYKAMGKKTRALDALIRGIASYGEGSAAAEEYGVMEKYDEIYQNILAALAGDYGLSEDQARELLGIGGGKDYTVLLTAIAEPDVILDTGEGETAEPSGDTYDDVYEDLDAGESGGQTVSEPGSEGTDVTQVYRNGGASDGTGAENAGAPGSEAGANLDNAGGEDAAGQAQEAGEQQNQNAPTGGVVDEPEDGSVLFEFKVDKNGNPIEDQGAETGGSAGADEGDAGANAIVPDSGFTETASPL